MTIPETLIHEYINPWGIFAQIKITLTDGMIVSIVLLTAGIIFLLLQLKRKIRKNAELTDELKSLTQQTEELNILLDCVADQGKINYFSGMFEDPGISGNPLNAPVMKFAMDRSERLVPEVREEYLQKYRSFFSGESKYFSITYPLTVNGQIKQLYDCAKLLPLTESGEKKFILTTMDMTELAKQTRELADADTILKAIFDNLPGHIFMKNMSSDFSYLRCNNSFSSLLHMQPSEVVGKNDFDLFDHDLAKRIRVCDMQIAANHTKADKRWVFTTPDGKEHATRFITRPLKRQDGSEVIIGFGIDITLQERMASKLRRRNKELRLLLAQTSDPAMLLDHNMHLTSSTPAMHSLFHDHLSSAEGKTHCRELCSCNVSDPELCSGMKALLTGETQICSRARLNGRQLYIKPLRNENAATVYLAVTAAECDQFQAPKDMNDD